MYGSIDRAPPSRCSAVVWARLPPKSSSSSSRSVAFLVCDECGVPDCTTEDLLESPTYYTKDEMKRLVYFGILVKASCAYACCSGQHPLVLERWAPRRPAPSRVAEHRLRLAVAGHRPRPVDRVGPRERLVAPSPPLCVDDGVVLCRLFAQLDLLAE